MASEASLKTSIATGGLSDEPIEPTIFLKVLLTGHQNESLPSRPRFREFEEMPHHTNPSVLFV